MFYPHNESMAAIHLRKRKPPGQGAVPAGGWGVACACEYMAIKQEQHAQMKMGEPMLARQRVPAGRLSAVIRNDEEGAARPNKNG